MSFVFQTDTGGLQVKNFAAYWRPTVKTFACRLATSLSLGDSVEAYRLCKCNRYGDHAQPRKIGWVGKYVKT